MLGAQSVGAFLGIRRSILVKGENRGSFEIIFERGGVIARGLLDAPHQIMRLGEGGSIGGQAVWIAAKESRTARTS